MNETVAITNVQTQVELSDKQLVLRAYKATVQKLEEMPSGPAKAAAEKRLIFGSIKRSKIEGVIGLVSLEVFLNRLTSEALHKDEQPGTGNIRMRFEVPAGYKAFTPYARVKELCAKGKLFKGGIKTAELYKDSPSGLVIEYRLHAPDIRPLQTEWVTFFLDPKMEHLVEWYAGYDKVLFPPTGDYGSQWVYLGGNLELEHARDRRAKRED